MGDYARLWKFFRAASGFVSARRRAETAYYEVFCGPTMTDCLADGSRQRIFRFLTASIL